MSVCLPITYSCSEDTDEYLREKWKGERMPEVSVAAQPVDFCECSVPAIFFLKSRFQRYSLQPTGNGSRHIMLCIYKRNGAG